MNYDNSRLTCRYPKLGLRWYECWERTTIIQLRNYARAFIQHMSTKWKSLTGEPCDILCPRTRTSQLEGFTIFHVHEVEKFNQRTLLYFMTRNRKNVTREIYVISCLRSGKVQLENSTLFMSTKWKSLIGELCDKSRPQSGKFQLKNLTIFHVYEVEKSDWNALRYIMSTKRKS